MLIVNEILSLAGILEEMVDSMDTGKKSIQ